MTPEELKTKGRAFYGYGYQSKLAKALGVHRTTVYRWMSGKSLITKGEEMRIERVLKRKKHNKEAK